MIFFRICDIRVVLGVEVSKMAKIEFKCHEFPLLSHPYDTLACF
ncbi:hypothetical protein HanPSC8_Chr13g0591381 [Helianthus annuus]|nr:hypothetical protein HanPSC8_Chr13g0591381 [Helianthus annuus]